MGSVVHLFLPVYLYIGETTAIGLPIQTPTDYIY